MFLRFPVLFLCLFLQQLVFSFTSFLIWRGKSVYIFFNMTNLGPLLFHVKHWNCFASSTTILRLWLKLNLLTRSIYNILSSHPWVSLNLVMLFKKYFKNACNFLLQHYSLLWRVARFYLLHILTGIQECCNCLLLTNSSKKVSSCLQRSVSSLCFYSSDLFFSHSSKTSVYSVFSMPFLQPSGLLI